AAPSAVSLPACTSTADITTAYNAWVAGFSVSGGCSPTSNTGSVPSLPANAACNGASLSFTLTANNGTGYCVATSSSSSTFLATADNIPPVITVCPSDQEFCKVPNNIYSIPVIQVTDNCTIGINYSYSISGATLRTGTDNDASGVFNVGVSVIAWTISDGCGNSTTTCSTTVTVNPLPVVTWNTILDEQCLTSTTYELTGGSPVGGTYSGIGVTGTNFDASVAGVGTHTLTFTYTNANGCVNSATQTITVVNCVITVDLKLFLQGYYMPGTGQIMQPVLNNQLVLNSLPTETDTVIVELHNPTTFITVDSMKAVLLTNGSVSATFLQHPGSYYIAIKHRNTIQTWSKDPVPCTFATPLYNFSLAANKAFGDNQILVETGVWAFYTGNLNGDDFIDTNDFPLLDNDAFNGVAFEYVPTDLNGDGFVDTNDFPVFDNNAFNGVTAMYPQ
ncbi:MAG: hypothetical protein ABIO04_02215, partial [Ferruginibacter sp.]